MNREQVQGLVAEFDNPAQLLQAAGKMRQAGYSRYDCHSPFPIHGMDEAMGEKRSFLAWIVGPVGFFALLSAFAFEGWSSAIAYPLVISGKPLFSYQAYGVVAFAVLVLISSIVTFVGMLIVNRLPLYHHPVFYSDNFARVTDDAFFVSVEAVDKKFDPVETEKFLSAIGGRNIELLIENDTSE